MYFDYAGLNKYTHRGLIIQLFYIYPQINLHYIRPLLMSPKFSENFREVHVPLRLRAFVLAVSWVRKKEPQTPALIRHLTARRG
jgi:hypothetical protein